MRGNRARDEDGELRQKRDDTKVGTIEKKYDVRFGVRADMKLETLLKKKGLKSLKELLEKYKR